jgi:hypothetical protein
MEADLENSDAALTLVMRVAVGVACIIAAVAWRILH